jgi:hypothetical protein
MSLQLLWDANADTQCVELPVTTYQWFRWASDVPARSRPTHPGRAPTVRRRKHPRHVRADPSLAAGEAAAGTAPPIATARGLVGDFFRRARLAGVASVHGPGRAGASCIRQPASRFGRAGPGRVSRGGGAAPPVGRRRGSKAPPARRLRAGGTGCHARRSASPTHRPAGTRADPGQPGRHASGGRKRLARTSARAGWLVQGRRRAGGRRWAASRDGGTAPWTSWTIFGSSRRCTDPDSVPARRGCRRRAH